MRDFISHKKNADADATAVDPDAAAVTRAACECKMYIVNAPGCVNAAGKLGQKGYATVVIKFTKPGAPTLADLCTREG